MSGAKDFLTNPKSGPSVSSRPAGLDQVGEDNASSPPGEETGIELPIEDGDFNAQPG